MIRENRQLSFLLPAILTVSLVLGTLPHTQASLREIPERLQLIAEEAAADPVAKKGADDSNAEAGPTAVGNFTDGVYTGSSRGYGGDITVQVTVKDGQIADIQILSAPGETEPYYSLATSVLDVVTTNQTWEVDTISGATYSSRGILGAIQNAITGETVENEAPPKAEPAGTKKQDAFKEPAAYKDGTYTGTADGFGGPITVEVVIKNGKIAGIRILSASYETGSYLGRARGVTDRVLKKGSPNVDAVSGATYSSTGIINAIKRALSKAATDKKADGNKKKPAKPAKPSKPQIPADLFPPDELVDGVYEGTGWGFGGEVVVKMTVEGGKITKLTVVSAKEETPKYFNQAKALLKNVIAGQKPDVDAVSGATLSSNGLLEAIMDAYKKAQKESAEPDPGTDPDPGNDPDPGVDPDPSPGGETDTEVVYQDGTYTGAGWCDDGEEFYYEILVSIRVTDGKVTTVSVNKGEDESDSPEDNDYYLNWAKVGRSFRGTFYPGVPAQIVSKQNADVDTVTGATYSSATIRSIAAQIISEIPTVEKEKPKDPDPTDPTQGETADPTDPTQGETADPTDPAQGETTDPADPTQGETTDPAEPTQGETTDPAEPTQSETTDTMESEERSEGGTASDRKDSEESGKDDAKSDLAEQEPPDAALPDTGSSEEVDEERASTEGTSAGERKDAALVEPSADSKREEGAAQ